MPYKSDAQRRFMHAKHPGIAARWDKEYPNQKGLPEHVAKKDSEKKSSEEEEKADGFLDKAKRVGKTVGKAAIPAAVGLAGAGIGAAHHKYKGPDPKPGNINLQSIKKGSDEVTPMTLEEQVIDTFQANAAALGAAEKLISEKQAADQAYASLVPKVIDICTKFGKIDNTPEEKQALAEMLATPAGALDVIAKLASLTDSNDGGSLGGQQVDSKGNVVHTKGQTKRASHSSLESPYVGRRSSEKPESWMRLEQGLGMS